MQPGNQYSATPLARKIGIKEGYKIYLFRPPDYFWTLFEDLPEDLEQVEKGSPESIDYLHIFAIQSNDLENALKETLPWLKKTGMLWISWPKKGSTIPSEVDKWMVLSVGRDAGMVDVKVAAIDQTWSGQKFVYGKQDR